MRFWKKRKRKKYSRCNSFLSFYTAHLIIFLFLLFFDFSFNFSFSFPWYRFCGNGVEVIVIHTMNERRHYENHQIMIVHYIYYKSSVKSIFLIFSRWCMYLEMIPHYECISLARSRGVFLWYENKWCMNKKDAGVIKNGLCFTIVTTSL